MKDGNKMLALARKLGKLSRELDVDPGALLLISTLTDTGISIVDQGIKDMRKARRSVGD